MLAEPRRDRITERRQATHAEILTAAWAVARENGLAQLTLRDVAERVGMRAPSLYGHFSSKNAIYDAMFAQAWTQCAEAMSASAAKLPRAPRSALRRMARAFFDFAVADLPRHQLMNQRTLPGFEPTPEAYRPAVETLDGARTVLARIGATQPQHVDLYLAVVGGLVDAQLANDPGGDRWARLVNPAMDMLADFVGLPGGRSAR